MLGGIKRFLEENLTPEERDLVFRVLGQAFGLYIAYLVQRLIVRIGSR